MIKEFKLFTDKRGVLLPIEFKELPFVPKRIFKVNQVPPGTIRGGHAHITTRQFFLCTSGQIIVYLNNGTRTWIVSLRKGQGIEIPPLTWDTQYFCKGSSAIVFASTEYDRKDYILGWDKFVRHCKINNSLTDIVNGNYNINEDPFYGLINKNFRFCSKCGIGLWSKSIHYTCPFCGHKNY